MAHRPRDLRRRTTISIPGQRQIMFFDYATVHTLAEVQAAGFFNDSRDNLTVGSIIDCVADINGTTARVVLRTTAVPPTGNVTVAVDGGLAAS
ncbi:MULTISPECIES: hypothetical protein [unclassified Agrobacterium]|uniref:hypothetical protein n=1 Tax=unclassified Agrobacterium TaxID=2632611 RepID=UPI0022AE8683|nr:MULTISPECIES: hypothetical protein [unclassified Agrobacterium]MCZ4073546.1 hypothetical protein [Agrobacterium sp. LMR679]MCZ4076238.1 hypothetical protein [Agrobacterium sp. LMR679]MCZ4076306.1 hypothetical protein [Agrobacterium sp. LMR679]MCZ7500699.1 hypothetical protein [Rhizobium rhizogenes]